MYRYDSGLHSLAVGAGLTQEEMGWHGHGGSGWYETVCLTRIKMFSQFSRE